jgi:hypothetical protein
MQLRNGHDVGSLSNSFPDVNIKYFTGFTGNVVTSQNRTLVDDTNEVSSDSSNNDIVGQYGNGLIGVIY